MSEPPPLQRLRESLAETPAAEARALMLLAVPFLPRATIRSLQRGCSAVDPWPSFAERLAPEFDVQGWRQGLGHSEGSDPSPGDADGFWDLVQENRDDLKWCGSSPFYTFLRAVPNARAQLLGYQQWNIDEQSVVSFAAMAFRQ